MTIRAYDVTLCYLCKDGAIAVPGRCATQVEFLLSSNMVEVLYIGRILLPAVLAGRSFGIEYDVLFSLPRFPVTIRIPL